MAEENGLLRAWISNVGGNAVTESIADQVIDGTNDTTGDSYYGADISNRITNLKTYTNNYWNESVSQMVNGFYDYLAGDDSTKLYGDVTVEDIKKADAGFSFDGDPYVRPNINIDGDSYLDVRAGDEIKAVLESDDNLQFTKNKGSDFIRLIMPKYTRRVEIEDLDRNFWVIAQVLDTLCDYLLNPDSALNKLLAQILKEITELWQNVYYLWDSLGKLDSKIENIATDISRVAENANKTQVTIDLNIYPTPAEKAREFRRMLQCSSTSEFVNVKALWYIGDGETPQWVKDKIALGIGPDWLTEDYLNNLDYLNSVRSGGDFYQKYPLPIKNNEITFDDSEKKSKHGVRNGCVIYWEDIGTFSPGSPLTTTKLVAYDLNHPYTFSNNAFYGIYQHITKDMSTSSPSAYLVINRMILETLNKCSDTVDKNNLYNLDGTKAENLGYDTYGGNISLGGSATNQSVGAFTVIRDGVNKKPLNKILSDLMSLNLTFVDLKANGDIGDKSCTYDLIPSSGSSSTFKKFRDSFINFLSLYKTDSDNVYNAEHGDELMLEWTGISVLRKKLGIKSTTTDGAYSYINTLVSDKNVNNPYLKSLINAYDAYIDTQSVDSYYNILHSYLYLLGISYSQLVPPAQIPEELGEDWLKGYEEAVGNIITDEWIKQNGYLDLSKMIELMNKRFYVTQNPTIFIECDHYLNQYGINFAEGNYPDYVKKHNAGYKIGDGHEIAWHLISSIIPENGMRIGYKTDRYDAPSYKIIPTVEINADERKYYLTKKLLSMTKNETQILGLNDEDKVLSGIKKAAFTTGCLAGMETAMISSNPRGGYLQPYTSGQADNYWISISSANATGGRVQMRIASSNIRAFNPPATFNDAYHGMPSNSDTFPHNTSISFAVSSIFDTTGSGLDDFKKTYLNSLLRFNGIENISGGVLGSSIPSGESVYYSYGSSKCWESVGTKDEFMDEVKQSVVDYSIKKKYSKTNGVVVDGFVGTLSPYNPAMRNIDDNKLFYEDTNETNGYLKTLRDYSPDTAFFRDAMYKLLTSPKSSDNSKNTKLSLSPAVYNSTGSGNCGNFRNIKVFGAYGSLTNDGFYKDFDRVKISDILGDNNVSTTGLIDFRIDMQRFATGGAVNNNYVTIFTSKDKNEIEQQEFTEALSNSSAWNFDV